jgi:uncharacterized protein YlxP (DUF503 family)
MLGFSGRNWHGCEPRFGVSVASLSRVGDDDFHAACLFGIAVVAVAWKLFRKQHGTQACV